MNLYLEIDLNFFFAEYLEISIENMIFFSSYILHIMLEYSSIKDYFYRYGSFKPTLSSL